MYSTHKYTDLVWISAGMTFQTVVQLQPHGSSREFAADLPHDVQSVELTDVNDIMSGHGQFSGSGVDSRLSGTSGGCSIRWLPQSWSLCPALVLRPAVYPDDPASISSTSATWSLLLLTLDFCLSTSEPAVSRHGLCPLLSAERVDSQLKTEQTTVSLVKMWKREFIYNVTASVSSELKDKHIHIWQWNLAKNCRISNKRVHKLL